MLYFWKKNKVLKIIDLILITCFACCIFVSCERDDLCAEGTANTPQLILRFYDAATTSDFKSATDLFITAVNDDNSTTEIADFVTTSTDSIAIPLRTDRNETKFLFVVNNDDENSQNTDTLTVAYETNNVYISRACGFATNFNITSIDVATDDNNWISNNLIVLPNVTDETEAHVHIFH